MGLLMLKALMGSEGTEASVRFRPIADMVRIVQTERMKLPPRKADELYWLQVQRRRRFNDAGREIWFTRFGWSYMPAHWKGLAALVLTIGLTLTACFALDGAMSGRFVFPMLVGWAFLMVLCERHSPTRR
jgi:hypothetical protein